MSIFSYFIPCYGDGNGVMYLIVFVVNLLDLHGQATILVIAWRRRGRRTGGALVASAIMNSRTDGQPSEVAMTARSLVALKVKYTGLTQNCKLTQQFD